MRWPLLLALAVLAAGCASNETPPSATSPSPAPGGGSNAPTNGTFAGVHFTHDYTMADETKTFDVPPGAGVLRLAAHITSSVSTPQSVCGPTQQPLHLKLGSPQNATVVNLDYSADGVSTTPSACGPSKTLEATFVPGTWIVTFSGTTQGTLIGTLDLAKG